LRRPVAVHFSSYRCRTEENLNIRIIADDDALTEREQQRLNDASAQIPRYFRNILSSNGTSRGKGVTAQ
jgi:hypothetical protein